MESLQALLEEAARLAETIRPAVAELRRDQLVGRAGDWDPAHFHDLAKRAGLDALSLATLLLCAAWEAPVVRVRLDDIRTLAPSVPTRVSAAALAGLIMGSCASTATGPPEVIRRWTSTEDTPVRLADAFDYRAWRRAFGRARRAARPDRGSRPAESIEAAGAWLEGDQAASTS